MSDSDSTAKQILEKQKANISKHIRDEGVLELVNVTIDLAYQKGFLDGGKDFAGKMGIKLP